MSDKIKRNLSLTDLDFHMDLDIESENSGNKKTEKSEDNISSKIGNTLDYYRDEMSKKEVEKILQSLDETESEVKAENPPETEKELSQKASDTGSFDYEYMLNLLRESKKEQAPIEETHEKSEAKSFSRTSRRRDESLKAFKIFRLSAFAIFALFLVGFAVLAYNMNKANNEIAVFKADVDKLKEDNADYEKLKIDVGGLRQEKEELERENNELRNQLEQNTGGEPSGGTDSAPEGSGGSQQTESGPVKYTVKLGDSLWKISERFYSDGSLYTEIKAANNIEKDTDIHEGMEIIIPDI